MDAHCHVAEVRRHLDARLALRDAVQVQRLAKERLRILVVALNLEQRLRENHTHPGSELKISGASSASGS